MKRYIQLFITTLSMVLINCAFAVDQASVLIASKGNTSLNAKIGNLTIQFKVKTHEFQIGKPSDARPAFIQSNCTYSRYPCSLVDQFIINVNGNSLFIPRSIFCDLADLSKAELKTEGNAAVLTLYGGDTSESFIVKIEFDALQIKRRTLSSAILPEQPLEETVYHTQVID